MELTTIVVAWIDSAFEVVKPGIPDLGVRAVLRAVPAPKAATWAIRGTCSDLESAQAEARRNGWTVFCFPVSETDPLGRARREIVAARPK